MLVNTLSRLAVKSFLKEIRATKQASRKEEWEIKSRNSAEIT